MNPTSKCGATIPGDDTRGVCFLRPGHEGSHTNANGDVWVSFVADRADAMALHVDVEGCDDCPAAVAVGEGFTVCALFVRLYRTAPSTTRDARPDWCPLARGPVTLRLPKKGGA